MGGNGELETVPLSFRFPFATGPGGKVTYTNEKGSKSVALSPHAISSTAIFPLSAEKSSDLFQAQLTRIHCTPLAHFKICAKHSSQLNRKQYLTPDITCISGSNPGVPWGFFFPPCIPAAGGMFRAFAL